MQIIESSTKNLMCLIRIIENVLSDWEGIFNSKRPMLVVVLTLFSSKGDLFLLMLISFTNSHWKTNSLSLLRCISQSHQPKFSVKSTFRRGKKLTKRRHKLNQRQCKCLFSMCNLANSRRCAHAMLHVRNNASGVDHINAI